MSGASSLLHDVGPNSDLGHVIGTLDRWGFTVAHTRFSVWTVLVAVVIVIGALVLARLAVRLSRIVLGKMTTLDGAQRVLAQKLVSLAIWTFTCLVAIQLLGIDLTALAVFSGAFGLALGFGLQKTFGNLLAGIILLMDRSIKPGDVIAVNDGKNSAVGQVKKIGIRAVSVTTRDKKEFLIPNENLMINQVENWSYSSKDVRIRIPVTVDTNTDLDLAEKLMLQAAREAPRVLDSPPPAVWLIDFAERGIVFEIRVWINDPEEGLASVKSEVLKRLWQLFQAHGVKLPNPSQNDLSLRDTPELRALIAAIRNEGPAC
ncbi:MAG: mechanosensitive ion channel domain-containing protein [Croceibacterium sp.]